MKSLRVRLLHSIIKVVKRQFSVSFHLSFHLHTYKNIHRQNNSWWRQWHPISVLLPGKPHGHRSLVGCSPWGREELDTTERLHFDFSLSFIGEGNGNPLQHSCLENPRDKGARRAAVYGVTQSRTQLKQRSSSSKTYMLNVRWKSLKNKAWQESLQQNKRVYWCQLLRIHDNKYMNNKSTF